MFSMKLAQLATYLLEALVLIMILLRFTLGRDVEVTQHTINLSEVVLYILALRFCVPILIRGEVCSFVGPNVSSQDEKLTCLLTGLGLMLLYNLVVYL